jgi:2,4-dienoyl-CoA reductase-like NADH-dependent reductase (Old Yellow Enzyme family)
VTKLAAAGKIYGAAEAQWVLDHGADIAVIGRGAILHHDFPQMAAADADFTVRPLPVTRQELRAEGLSDSFVGYMKNWPGFVADD